MNGQNSLWENVKARVCQGAILGPLLFLVYISELPENLSTNVELFTDNTSFFLVCTLSLFLLGTYVLNGVKEWAYGK